jgi:hypothetical protein
MLKLEGGSIGVGGWPWPDSIRPFPEPASKVCCLGHGFFLCLLHGLFPCMLSGSWPLPITLPGSWPSTPYATWAMLLPLSAAWYMAYSIPGCYLGHGLLPCIYLGQGLSSYLLSVDGLFTFSSPLPPTPIHLCVSGYWWMLKFFLQVLASFPFCYLDPGFFSFLLVPVSRPFASLQPGSRPLAEVMLNPSLCTLVYSLFFLCPSLGHDLYNTSLMASSCVFSLLPVL